MHAFLRNLAPVVATFALAGCGETPPPPVKPPPAASAEPVGVAVAAKTIKIAEADAGKTIEAHLGDTLELTLETNPSTGYDWQVDAVDKALGDPKITRPEGPAKAVGAATTMTFTWKLAAAGDHPVALAYRRPWEKDDPPEKAFKFTVRVAK